jgi:hypothetical protein
MAEYPDPADSHVAARTCRPRLNARTAAASHGNAATISAAPPNMTVRVRQGIERPGQRWRGPHGPRLDGEHRSSWRVARQAKRSARRHDAVDRRMAPAARLSAQILQ